MNKVEKLRGIVERCLNDVLAKQAFDLAVIGILTHLGVSRTKAERFLAYELIAQPVPNLTLLEERLRESLAALGVYRRLPKRMTERARDWFGVIEPYLRNGMRVLDLGGGSGELAVLLANWGCEVVIADVQDRRAGKAKQLPFHLVNNNQISTLEDQTFDLVLLATVLHHADDVEAIIQLADSLAPTGKILAIESVAERGWFGYVALVDWFYNHLLHFNEHPDEKVNVPCHFRSIADWENLFQAITGRVARTECLMIFMKLNPEPHYLVLA